MAICPYNHNIRCGMVGECEGCCHKEEAESDHLDGDYDSETEDAMRVDYDESDPW